MHYLRILAIVVGLVAVSRPAAALQICGRSFNNNAEVAQKSASFVRTMRIAKAQGDIAGMRTAYDDFYRNFASACDAGPNAKPGAEFRAVCGYDCHVQLAEFHLFMASDIEYYAAKGSGTGLASLLLPEAMAKEVNEGVRIVDSGIALLTSSTGGASPEGLRGYLRDVGALNILRAKLYMAQGDAFYKNISEARIERLAYLAGKAVDQDPQVQGASMVSLARAGYDAALWGLNEALLEIPEESYFNALYLEAHSLAKELKERRDSLLKGLLFIGIDPDEYKLVDINDQKARLQQTSQNVSQLENQIESVVRTYLSKKTDIQTSNARNEQELANQAISVSTYRVGTIENLAEQHRAALQLALENVSAKQAGYERERARVEALFTMNQQALETQNRLALLTGTKEVEVISFQRDQVVQQINELQWLMNWEVSKTNLELQVDSMDSQFVGMDRDVAKSRLTLEQLGLRLLQTNNQIATSNNNIVKFTSDIAVREAQRGPIFEATKRGAATSICEVEEKLNRLKDNALAEPFSWKEGTVTKTCASLAPIVPGEPNLDPALKTKSEYIKTRCDMRTKALDARIGTSAEVLICVVGIDQLPVGVQAGLVTYLEKWKPGTTLQSYARDYCPAVRANCENVPNVSGITCDDMYKTARAAYGERMKLAEKKVQALIDWKNALENDRIWLGAQVALQVAGRAIDMVQWASQLGAITATQAAANALPKITIGMIAAGMTSGGFTMDNSAWQIAKEQADLAAKQAKETHDMLLRVQDTAAFALQVAERIKDLERSITKLSGEIDQAKISAELQKLETAQAIVEITGRSLDLSGQLQSVISELDLEKINCTDQTYDLNSEVAQLQFRHASLVSQQKAAQLENDIVQTAIDGLQLQITNEGLTIDNLNLTLADTRLEIKKVQEDIDSIEGSTTRGIIGLRQRTNEQKAKLLALLGHLNQQADENARLTAVRNTLSSELFHASVKLKDTEIAHVQNLLDGQKSHTDQVIDLLNHIEDAAIAGDGKKAELAAAYLAMQQNIAAERQNMLNTAEQIFTQVRENRPQEIYLSNEEVASQLTKGIPEFLQQKRRLMQIANYELALLYNKVNALHSTVSANVGIGLTGNSDPVAFVRTADDLTRVVAGFDNTLFRDQAIVQSEVLSIEIPRTSGFARKLASERQADFEITPAADGKMAENGYFQLWHDVLKQPRAFTVLDMNLVVIFDVRGCQRQRFRLYHEGTGFRFFAPGGGAAEPLFFTSASRRHDPKYYIDESDITEFRTAWGPTFSLFGFWMGQVHPSYDPGALLPLLGTPVIGSYHVEVDPAVSENQTAAGNLCSYDNASLRLLVAYSKITGR